MLKPAGVQGSGGQHSTLHHIAILLRSLGLLPSVNRIYLAGVHPSFLGEAMSMLTNQWEGATAAFESVILPKIVLYAFQLFSSFVFPLPITPRGTLRPLNL